MRLFCFCCMLIRWYVWRMRFVVALLWSIQLMQSKLFTYGKPIQYNKTKPQSTSSRITAELNQHKFTHSLLLRDCWTRLINYSTSIKHMGLFRDAFKSWKNWVRTRGILCKVQSHWSSQDLWRVQGLVWWTGELFWMQSCLISQYAWLAGQHAICLRTTSVQWD